MNGGDRMSQNVDIFEESLLFQIEFELNINKWATMDEDIKALVSSGWKCVKYLNEDSTAVHTDVYSIPNDCGGIYIFMLKPDIVPNKHRYIMYIGRAHRASNYSLRKRCVTYINDTRPKVARMMRRWGKELYLYYLPIHNTDAYIDKVEKELLRVIIPPMNSQIPEHYILPEENMF